MKSIILLLSVALAGCANIAPIAGLPAAVVVPTVPENTRGILAVDAPRGIANASQPAALAYYRAYGDSITAGTGAAPGEGFVSLVGAAANLPTVNSGLSGTQACDTAGHDLYSVSDPSLTARGLYTLLVSTNDVTHNGAGAYEAVFNLCHQAAIAWLAVPNEYKIIATAKSVTVSGWTFQGSGDWPVVIGNEIGASATFPVYLAAPAPVYVWYLMTDGSAGTFSYAVDGVVLGKVTTAPTTPIFTARGGTQGVALLRVPSTPAGTHAIKFVQTGGGYEGMSIVAVGYPPVRGPNSPEVLVGTTPRQVIGATTSYGCTVTDAPCLAYIADIKANVALLAGDGLDVRVFDTRKYLTGVYPVDMADALHPNAEGHKAIAKSVLEAK